MTDLEDLKQKPAYQNQASRLSGAGMDRTIKQNKWTVQRMALLGAGVVFLALIGYGIFELQGPSRFRVESDRITQAAVQQDVFQEYISVMGRVEPQRTVYLDVAEGGRVEEIYVEEGASLEAGDPIVRLSNNDLQLDLLNREAQFYETMNYLRQARLAMDQNTLNLRQQLVEINYQMTRLRRQHERNTELFGKQLISEEEYHLVKDEYEYQSQRRDLTLASHQQDSLLRVAQVNQLEASVNRMQRNLDVVRANLENLVVKAPITGQLTSFDVEIGESINVGQRMGQIDRLDGFRVKVPVDEHYLPRVTMGLGGEADLSGKTFGLEIRKVYPEVREGRFEIDMLFTGTAPEQLRRGQTMRIRLALGDLSEAILVP